MVSNSYPAEIYLNNTDKQEKSAQKCKYHKGNNWHIFLFITYATMILDEKPSTRYV